MAEKIDLRLYHGIPFKATINNVNCEGRITVENGQVYLCQNSCSGSDCMNKQGFRYSWLLGSPFHTEASRDQVNNLKLELGDLKIIPTEMLVDRKIHLGDLIILIHIARGNAIIGEFLYPDGNKATPVLLKSQLVQEGWEILKSEDDPTI